ncbi:MAG: nucleotidyltransferase domain-containing protein [Coleofasciculus sp. C1-SOL-03]|uniref:nucleotidyltransferase family protein n=1 Tax=Coleofasciculus sp. C1-SOL-03 TaxID=3069522 RepID=UPI0032F8D5AE
MNDSRLSTVAHQIPIPPSITISDKSLKKLCQHWQIVELSLFGSILREDFNADSDIDVLVEFSEKARITFFDLDLIEQQLSQLFHRPVDVVTKSAIQQSHNPIRRQNILDNSKVIYEQRQRGFTGFD